MDPTLMRALHLRKLKRKKRRRPDRTLALNVFALVSTEVSLSVTQTVVLSQRLSATGALASARYRR